MARLPVPDEVTVAAAQAKVAAAEEAAREAEKLAAAQAAAAARKKKGIGNLKDAFEGDEAVARGAEGPSVAIAAARAAAEARKKAAFKPGSLKGHEQVLKTLINFNVSSSNFLAIGFHLQRFDNAFDCK